MLKRRVFPGKDGTNFDTTISWERLCKLAEKKRRNMKLQMKWKWTEITDWESLEEWKRKMSKWGNSTNWQLDDSMSNAENLMVIDRSESKNESDQSDW